MIKPKMIENEKDFCCCQGHKLPVVTIALDPQLSRNQRLLCTECLENTDLDAKVVGLKKMISLIEEAQLKKMEKVDYIIVNQIKLIEQLHSIIDQMRSYAIQQFDSQITIIKEWIRNLQQQRSQSQYSFYEQLEIMIINQNKIDDNSQQLIHQIQQTNHSWTSKLYPKLELFNTFLEYQKCKELFSKLEQSTQTLSINQQQQQQQQIKIDQLNHDKQESLQKTQIKLKLIDQSVKQNDRCNTIVFDSSGSIMVSTQNKDIKVWSFLNGTIKLVKTLQGHTNWVECLVYSKKKNSFISCSTDKTIRCWQSMNQTEWISSQPYEQHTDFVICIVLNQNEDLLFSGSDDQSIKVWKVDFNQNKLVFLYSLDKHNNDVVSLSLNQSENQLVSCARGQNQIIIWERREKDKFEFKYFVIIDEICKIKNIQNNQIIQVINYFTYKQSINDFGFKVKFIKENQFIWITGDKQLDRLYVFELKQGVYQENQDKTIQFITNKENYDQYRFPIIYNKERNLIVVRHKKYIYIIREINDGNYKIEDQLNCDTCDIYGNITNNGQYLVYWDGKNQAYSTYELLNK